MLMPNSENATQCLVRADTLFDPALVLRPFVVVAGVSLESSHVVVSHDCQRSSREGRRRSPFYLLQCLQCLFAQGAYCKSAILKYSCADR